VSVNEEPPPRPPQEGETVGIVGVVKLAWYAEGGLTFGGRWWARIETASGVGLTVPWDACVHVLDVDDPRLKEPV